jgi:hypothetical protein
MGDMARWREELAWAAGLFEGSGTIVPNGTLPVLRIGLTDRGVLERFHKIVGVGKIYGPYTKGYRDGYKRKPTWVWLCQGQRARDLFDALAPWLSARRLAQAQNIRLIP